MGSWLWDTLELGKDLDLILILTLLLICLKISTVQGWLGISTVQGWVGS